jgi:hypothetical protein
METPCNTSHDLLFQWYPNVIRVTKMPSNPKSSAHQTDIKMYQLITKILLIGQSILFIAHLRECSTTFSGEVTSNLTVHANDHLRSFIYSVDSWLLETNILVFQEDPNDANLTHVEWTVGTNRRSLLFHVRRCVRIEATSSPCLVLSFLAFDTTICSILQKSVGSRGSFHLDDASPTCLIVMRHAQDDTNSLNLLILAVEEINLFNFIP